jgi:hypothetical protein
MNLRVVLLNIILHVILNRLNWTQIRGARRPFNYSNSCRSDYRLCKGRSVPFCIVLLELKLRILLYDLVDEGDNNARVRALIYCLPVLLPKEPLMPAVFPTNTPLKLPSNLPLIPCLYIVLVVEFVWPDFACNIELCVSARLCPCLVTPKDLIPLLVRPINVFLCPLKPLLPIFL